MAFAVNDEVLIVNNEGKKIAVGLPSLAVNDNTVIIPISGQKSVAVQTGSLAVNDEVMLFPDTGNKFIALKSGITYTPGTCITKWSATLSNYGHGNIYVDQSNDIWISDDTSKISKYNPVGTLLLSWTDTTHIPVGTAGDVVTDLARNVYVCRYGANYLVKYDNAGNYLGTCALWPSTYVSDSSRLAVDANGAIFVPEHQGGTNNYMTTKNATNPSWSSGVMNVPNLGPLTGIDIKGSTHLYALIGSLGVVKIHISGTSSSMVWSYSAGFNSPYGLAVDINLGYIYVSDSVNNNITVLNPDGTLKATWTGYIYNGTTYSFSGPMDCAMDDSYHLYIADKGSGQILKLQGLRS